MTPCLTSTRRPRPVFAGKVVRKDLVRKVKVGANVPVFVLEYLLGKYCATDDPAAIDAGLRVVNTTISSNFVRPDEANKVQSLVKDKGKHTLDRQGEGPLPRPTTTSTGPSWSTSGTSSSTSPSITCGSSTAC